MKNLFYVVKPQLDDVDGFAESNGWKTIVVYTIKENILKQFFCVECELYNNPEEGIQEYLDDNGYSDEIFKMIQL